MSAVRPRAQKLSSQIFLAQLAILTTTIAVGFLLFAHAERSQLDTQYEARAASIAQTVAAVPQIQRCMETHAAGCGSTIQSIATVISRATDASYVVVIGMNRVRYSHPIAALIGQQVSEPIATVDGRVHLSIDNGSTGRSANGKAPLYGPDRAMVGEVSVGIRESSVVQALWSELPSYAAWFGIALSIGALASFGLAAHLKRRTFGLELDEIVQLLQEREATLHGIREGVIAFDESGRVTVVNDEAHRLLMLPANAIGSHLRDIIPEGRLRSVMEGRDNHEDDIVLTDDLCLVVNRMPVVLQGRAHGAVVTLRDSTEMTGLRSELAGERGLTDSLRAQQHEFANRLHAVAGLLQLGRGDEALAYLLEIGATAAEFDNALRTQIAAPQIVGLLLGKAAKASELGVELVIAPDSWLSETPSSVQALVSIVGNLVDNALEALVAVPPPRRVVVSIIEEADAMTVDVADNGPGLPRGAGQMVFADGYTTKDGERRGLGLAIVHRLVTRLHGTITASEGAGAHLAVRLPKPRPVDVAEGVS